MNIHPGAAALAILFGLGAAASGYAASTPKPLTCDITAIPSDGAVLIEGIVTATSPLSGSYQFKVRSQGDGGSSNISQGGDFDATPGAPTTIGQVTLANDCGTFDVTLAIDAGGTNLECHKTLSGNI
jgi:hypothetical protein